MSDRTLGRIGIGIAAVSLLLLVLVLMMPGRFGLVQEADASEEIRLVQDELGVVADRVSILRTDARKLAQGQSRINQRVFILKRGPKGLRGVRGPRGKRGPKGTVDGIDLVALAERVGEVAGAQRRQDALIAEVSRDLRAADARLRSLQASTTR